MSREQRRSFTKIAIVGSHGCGKTTLAYQLASAFKLRNISVGLVTEQARLCPFPLHTKEAREWIVYSQMKAELEMTKGHSVLICDRSTYDSIAYTYASNSSLPQHVMTMILEHLNTYDCLLHIPPSQPLEADGFRDTDETFRQAVYKEFLSIFPKTHDYDKRSQELIKLVKSSYDYGTLNQLCSFRSKPDPLHKGENK